MTRSRTVRATLILSPALRSGELKATTVALCTNGSTSASLGWRLLSSDIVILTAVLIRGTIGAPLVDHKLYFDF
ncbi:exported hypothetical protein [Bradyrhizobium sp. STM 3843]|nr:exported hypothetical protein [Bradyrhizobium sp. STM 3843]